MNKVRIYLAGTIYNEEPDSSWKKRFIDILNPVKPYYRNGAGKLIIQEDVSLPIMEHQYNHKYDFFDPDPQNEPYHYMVQRDKAEIEKSDIFVAYIQRPSFGTAMEILYANMLQTKPVFIINPNSKFDNDLWVTYHASMICQNVEDCANHIKTIKF